MTIIRKIRLFVLCEGATFLMASLIHFGVLIGGYEHREASIAEAVLGFVLVAGFVSTWIWPTSTRRVGLGVQAFALFGTLVGISMVMIGVGARTAPDITYHIGVAIALVSGLRVAFRADPPPPA